MPADRISQVSYRLEATTKLTAPHDDLAAGSQKWSDFAANVISVDECNKRLPDAVEEAPLWISHAKTVIKAA